MEILKVRGYQNQGARKRGVGTHACKRRFHAISFIRTFRHVHPTQFFVYVPQPSALASHQIC